MTHFDLYLTVCILPQNGSYYVKSYSWRKNHYFYQYSYKLYQFLDAETSWAHSSSWSFTTRIYNSIHIYSRSKRYLSLIKLTETSDSNAKCLGCSSTPSKSRHKHIRQGRKRTDVYMLVYKDPVNNTLKYSDKETSLVKFLHALNFV